MFVVRRFNNMSADDDDQIILHPYFIFEQKKRYIGVSRSTMSFAVPVPPPPLNKLMSEKEMSELCGIQLKRRDYVDLVQIRFGTKLVGVPARIQAIVNALAELTSVKTSDAVDAAWDNLCELGRDQLNDWWYDSGSAIIMKMVLDGTDACIFIGDTRTRLPPETSKLLAARDVVDPTQHANGCDKALEGIDAALYTLLDAWWDDHCAILFDEIREQLTPMEEVD